jgi:phosphatidylglycerophosphatase A
MYGLNLSPERAVVFLAQGLGVGRSPVAPGTFGTLIGLPLVWLQSSLDPLFAVMLAVAFGLFAVPVAGRAARYLDSNDDGSIVIDEIAGYLVAMTAVPLTAWSILAGFVLFRLFDIIKPPPIGLCERKIKGGAGIVADDIAAGIMTNIVLQAGMWWL